MGWGGRGWLMALADENCTCNNYIVPYKRTSHYQQDGLAHNHKNHMFEGLRVTQRTVDKIVTAIMVNETISLYNNTHDRQRQMYS